MKAKSFISSKGKISSTVIFWGRAALLKSHCNCINGRLFWTTENFAKSWGRHPSIIKKKCIKKFLLSGYSIEQLLSLDKYLETAPFFEKRKWKLVMHLLNKITIHAAKSQVSMYQIYIKKVRELLINLVKKGINMMEKPAAKQ